MSFIGRTPTNAALIASDLADGIVGTTKIAADAVTAAKIADNAVVTAAINADAVTDAKIADDIVGTEHLTANEVDTAALKGDAVTGAELADNAVNSEHYTDGSIDTVHLADNQITLAKLAGGTDGNIISYDASGDPVAIATGNDGQVLTSAGAGAPPVFETPAAGGKILQVLQTVDTTGRTTTSASFASMTLNGNITPSATNSKIFVFVQAVMGVRGNKQAIFDFARSINGGNHAVAEASGQGQTQAVNSDNHDTETPGCLIKLDSPSTTTQVNYRVDAKVNSGGTATFGRGGYSTMILMEVGA